MNMVDSQQIDIAEHKLDSVRTQTAKLQNRLLKLVKGHGMSENDTFWWQAPADSGGAWTNISLSREESKVFEAMSDAEKTAWCERRTSVKEYRHRRKQGALPVAVRTALVQLNELRDMDFQLASELANKMFKRGLIGLIADKLLLQDDSAVELYLDRVAGVHCEIE
jgi:hypothetical protein